MSIASQLIKLRTERNLSPTQAAKVVGLAPVNWRRFESGSQLPSEATRARIESAFDLEHGWLTSDLRDPAEPKDDPFLDAIDMVINIAKSIKEEIEEWQKKKK